MIGCLRIAGLCLLTGTAQLAANPLTQAARGGDAGALNTVLSEQVVDVDRPDSLTGLTALTIASLRGDAAIVETLLAAGADPDAAGPQGMPALAALTRSCGADSRIAKMLLDAGADPDARSGAGLTPAMTALQSGRSDLANLIIAAGADVNAVNSHGDGLLNFAIYFRQPETIALLLSRNADTAQLSRLFRTDGYYQLGFGAATVAARELQCRTG